MSAKKESSHEIRQLNAVEIHMTRLQLRAAYIWTFALVAGMVGGGIFHNLGHLLLGWLAMMGFFILKTVRFLFDVWKGKPVWTIDGYGITQRTALKTRRVPWSDISSLKMLEIKLKSRSTRGLKFEGPKPPIVFFESTLPISMDELLVGLNGIPAAASLLHKNNGQVKLVDRKSLITEMR